MTKRNPEDDGYDRNEDGQQVAGAVSGATAGTVGGGIGAAVGGPLGAVLGALVGIAGGWWAGREMHDSIAAFDELDDKLATHAQRTGHPYDEVRHAYQLGYLAGRNPRYADEGFEAAAKDLKTAWVHAHQEEEDAVGWEEIRENVRHGFESARERR